MVDWVGLMLLVGGARWEDRIAVVQRSFVLFVCSPRCCCSRFVRSAVRMAGFASLISDVGRSTLQILRNCHKS
jgi:hypothetical protein